MPTGRRARGGRPARPGGPGPGTFAHDPTTGSSAEVRRIQPYEARKLYRCPGCNHEIAPGVGHVVVVPLGAPGERRHWHEACWLHRERRRPGR
ncbi:MAG: hypothetical protein M0Z33_07930 [Actinomycetota bacterium]|nr:hypothetical protein [Actinomycetota bacterium]